MYVLTTMKGFIITCGIVALVHACFKDGPGNILKDVLIILALSVGMYALYTGYTQQKEKSGNESPLPVKQLSELKFFNAYDKIKDAVIQLQVVRRYNPGDFMKLAKQVDEFVKKYQYLYNSGMAKAQAEQHIDLLLDMRTNLLETVQSFFVCVPDSDDVIKKQYMKLQSITYHMIKKVQQTMGTRRMWFPRPRCSLSHYSRRASSWII